MTPRCRPTSEIKAFIFAAGSDGDIHPHLGLASELAARGHKVFFLTSFDYLDRARACGFEALDIIEASDRDEFEGANEASVFRRLQSRCRYFSRKVAAICGLVAPMLDEQSVLIAPPFAAPVARLLQIRYGAPYISTVLSPASLCSLCDPPALRSGEWFARLPRAARQVLFRGAESLIIDPGFRWLLKDVLRTMQAPRPRRVIREWCYSPQRVLGLFPDWFCSKPEDWPAQLVLTGFPLFHPRASEQELSPGLKSFLDAGARPVVFTAGTETRTVQSFFDIALRTAQSLAVRAVFLSRLADQVPRLPGTIYYERYASLQLLLSRAAAIVHHGGIGTTAQAMAAGIPQLILPERLDQFDNARHVAELGCGLVQKDVRDRAAAAEKLRWLFRSPEIAQSCRSLRERVAPGSAACSRAADVIEETGRTARMASLPPARLAS